MPTDWDPDQYRRFEAERSAPFWDLVALVEPGVGRMVDLGCGDGDLTMAAAERLGVESVVGIDSSPAMVARAEHHDDGRHRFVAGDIAAWTGAGDVDLVLANASLQWVPDHRAVLRQWRDALAPGGQLAVQVPANGDHPSHTVADEVARRQPFLDAFDGAPPPNPTGTNVLAPQEYATLLHELGFTQQHVRLQVYPHLLGASSDVVEWVRGTNLTRFFRLLPDMLHEPFVDAYRTALLERIGEEAPYFYAFTRILMWGRLDS
ncbi:MAG: methyltransferase domain-containing protein [Ilumatobacteraceae bacterium]